MQKMEALVLGAEHDALIAPSLAQSTAGPLGAKYECLEGMGHAVMLNDGFLGIIARWQDRRQILATERLAQRLRWRGLHPFQCRLELKRSGVFTASWG